MLCAEFVTSVLLKTPLGFFFSQAILDVGIELLGDILICESVSGSCHRMVGLARDMGDLFNQFLAHFEVVVIRNLGRGKERNDKQSIENTGLVPLKSGLEYLQCQ